MVSYRVTLDVPRDLIWFVSGLLADHRREIGTRKGAPRLGCYRQALFGLASFRDKGDIPRLGAVDPALADAPACYCQPGQNPALSPGPRLSWCYSRTR